VNRVLYSCWKCRLLQSQVWLFPCISNFLNPYHTSREQARCCLCMSYKGGYVLLSPIVSKVTVENHSLLEVCHKYRACAPALDITSSLWSMGPYLPSLFPDLYVADTGLYSARGILALVTIRKMPRRWRPRGPSWTYILVFIKFCLRARLNLIWIVKCMCVRCGALKYVYGSSMRP